jgi:hypothetical protein
MTLSALIRNRDTGNLATAIHAISATQPKGKVATVAKIATVAVANPKEMKIELVGFSTATLAKISHRIPLEAACCPEVTHADTLKRFPQADKGRAKR